MTIPASAQPMNVVPEMQFQVGTATVGVTIEPIDTVYIYLLEKKPSDGLWYIVAYKTLPYQSAPSMLQTALNATGHPTASPAGAETFANSTNTAIAADVVKSWFVANILPTVHDMIAANYLTATAPTGGTTVNTSLGLFQYMLANTHVTVDVAGGTISLNAAF